MRNEMLCGKVMISYGYSLLVVVMVERSSPWNDRMSYDYVGW